jgi:hypothetical protein
LTISQHVLSATQAAGANPPRDEFQLTPIQHPFKMLASLIVAHPRGDSERETLDVSFLSGFD